MKIHMVPLDYEHVALPNKIDLIKIFGRTQEGKSVCLIDEITNYFYVLAPKKVLDKVEDLLKKTKNAKKLERIRKNYLEEEVTVLKVECAYKDYKELKEIIREREEDALMLEMDIPPITRYIIDKECKPLLNYEIQASEDFDESWARIEESVASDLILRPEKINEKKQKLFTPKVIAFDLETEGFEAESKKILMIGVACGKERKVFTWKKDKAFSMKNVEVYEDEADMIEAFANYVKEQDPDIITGYFSDNFDMPFLRQRADKFRVPLLLGKDNSRITFSRGNRLSARIKGLVHVDIFRFIENAYAQYMTSETLSLDDVAQELLGDKKIETNLKGKAHHELTDDEFKQFIEYNLKDADLTLRLFEKVWPDMVGFVEVMQEPLFDVTRDGMSTHVDDYLIHNLKRFNEIAKPRPSHQEITERRAKARNIGAFVLQPEPKLYENLSMFDFTSYWPSIIVSFNLSATTFVGTQKPKDYSEKKYLKADIEGKTFYFTKKKGFFPTLLSEIIEKRKEAKKALKEKDDPLLRARSAAYKVLANSSYGYLGFFGARYYSYEAQGTTTGLSRDFIKKIIDKTNKEDYNVIYADTDGFAFSLNKHSQKETLAFLKKLNESLPGIMELELEDFYTRGIWVTKRDGEYGAKKKYALINEKGILKIRGFETVRRDWCKLARNTQSEILEKILKEGNGKSALTYMKTQAKKLRDRKVDINQLVVKTQLKKPLDDYKANTPHVIIARKMMEQGKPVKMGTLIEYIITTPDKGKKSLVRERAKLVEETTLKDYDIEYYLTKQLIPAVENIFAVLDIDINKELEKVTQKTLADF